ncbi:MAG: hypothetical protein DMG00_29595 [Acidobacteria bacterium]|nr:MAG: hypothetical protein DMG00_29595 [Acidobacteriota bacterium]
MQMRRANRRKSPSRSDDSHIRQRRPRKLHRAIHAGRYAQSRTLLIRYRRFWLLIRGLVRVLSFIVAYDSPRPSPRAAIHRLRPSVG